VNSDLEDEKITRLRNKKTSIAARNEVFAADEEINFELVQCDSFL
jgi:hypothetical protein